MQNIRNGNGVDRRTIALKYAAQTVISIFGIDQRASERSKRAKRKEEEDNNRAWNRNYSLAIQNRQGLQNTSRAPSFQNRRREENHFVMKISFRGLKGGRENRFLYDAKMSLWTERTRLIRAKRAIKHAESRKVPGKEIVLRPNGP